LEFCEVWFRFDLTGDSEPMYTHLAYGVGATVTQAAVDAGFTQAQTTMKTRFHSSVSLAGGHLLEQTSTGIRRWDASIAPVAGTNVNTPLPNNCATLIKKSTALGGRRNRGRMYFPCPIENEVGPEGANTSAAVTAWNSVVATLMPGGSIHTAFGVLGNPQVLHETGSQTPAQVTDLACQAKIATQRRRMRR
jgi:hypothetical protein